MPALRTRRSLLATSAIAGGVAVSLMVSSTAAAQSKTYNIPAESLSQALRDYGRQSGLQLIFTEELARGRSVAGVHGAMAPGAALSALLAGSGLRAQSTPGGVVMIVRDSGPPGVAAGSPAAEPSKVSEVVVTGTNIRGAAPAGAQLKIYTRADIERTGSGTVQQFLTTVPQNFSSINSTSVFVGGEGQNTDFGTGVNLRGISSRTTLTLLNGHRLPQSGVGVVTDISSIPVAAIDRIEILPDGASAIYGSDAVAGVVNISLSKSYDGAETRVRTSERANSSSTQTAISQAFGRSWSTGGTLLTGSYLHTSPLLAGDRSYAYRVGADTTLDPKQSIYSVLGSVHQDLFDQLTVTLDGIYSKKKNYANFNITAFNYHLAEKTETDEYDIDAGLEYRASQKWVFSANVSHGVDRLLGTVLTANSTDLLRQRVTEVQAKVNGDLFSLPAGTVKVAAGYDGRWERGTRSNSSYINSGLISAPFSRDVQAEFAELNIPIVDGSMAIPLMTSLTVSGAVRHEHYPDFGDTTNPKLGLDWVVVPGVKLQATYGTSFSASRFLDTQTAFNSGAVVRLPGPGCPTAGCLVLFQTGYNTSYKPERSKSYTFGLDLRPEFLPGASAHFGYYHIDYRDRIGQLPTRQTIINNVSLFGNFVTASPSAQFILNKIAEIQAFPQGISNQTGGPYDVSQFDYFVDTRQANIGKTTASGLDFDISYYRNVGSARWVADLSGTYIFSLKNQFSPVAMPVTGVDRFGTVDSTHIVGSIGVETERYTVNVMLNYYGRFLDDTMRPATAVGSWATVDTRISLNLGDVVREAKSSLQVSLIAQNLFDRAPNYAPAAFANFGYDPSKANAFGRVMSIELVKRF